VINWYSEQDKVLSKMLAARAEAARAEGDRRGKKITWSTDEIIGWKNAQVEMWRCLGTLGVMATAILIGTVTAMTIVSHP
jgi:hypothetical protein